MTKTTHPRLRLLRSGEIGYQQKYYFGLVPSTQSVQKGDLNRFAAFYNHPSDEIIEGFQEYRTKWMYCQWAKGAVIIEATSSTSLAADISRPGIYENAGLPLHPIFGFFEIPESEVKGCTRAYAETIWFPEQYRCIPERNAPANSIEPASNGELEKAINAWQQIETVFGWAPDSNRGKGAWLPESVRREVEARRQGQPASIGAIFFGPGIPKDWTSNDQDDGTPRLHVEILNNHHRDYYRGKGWPGEWENPMPTYFLALRAGAVFRFPLRTRGPEVEPALLDLSQGWLVAALARIGVGAKTGVGYGYFHPQMKICKVVKAAAGRQNVSDTRLPSILVTEEQPDLVQVETRSGTSLDDKLRKEIEELLPGVRIGRLGHRLELELDVELLTPAFLAGANQTANDWKDYAATANEVGGSPRALEELAKQDCRLFAKSFKSGIRAWWRTMHSGFLTKEEFAAIEGALFGSTESGNRVTIMVEELQKKRVPQTLQSLFYTSYGMDQRHFLTSPQHWVVRIAVPRSAEVCLTKDQGTTLPQAAIVKQVATALNLFGLFGGVGAKSRKGFGSFRLGKLTAPSSLFLEKTVSHAQEEGNTFRNEARIGTASFDPTRAASASLSQLAVDPHLIFCPRSGGNPLNPMKALGMVGGTLQEFAGNRRPKRLKAGLGLPRRAKIASSVVVLEAEYRLDGSGHPRHHDDPDIVAPLGPPLPRWASPVHIRRLPADDGFVFSVIAFESSTIPYDSTTSSGELLGNLSQHLKDAFPFPERKLDKDQREEL